MAALADEAVSRLVEARVKPSQAAHGLHVDDALGELIFVPANGAWSPACRVPWWWYVAEYYNPLYGRES